MKAHFTGFFVSKQSSVDYMILIQIEWWKRTICFELSEWTMRQKELLYHSTDNDIVILPSTQMVGISDR